MQYKCVIYFYYEPYLIPVLQIYEQIMKLDDRQKSVSWTASKNIIILYNNPQK